MKTLTVILATLILAGCVTPKTKLLAGAQSVRSVTAHTLDLYECKQINSGMVVDQHPNNVNRVVTNDVFMEGGTHYKITAIIDTDYKERPTSVSYDIYKCSSTYK